MRQPAVPYHEHSPREEAERICAENGLSCNCDRFGNLLVRLQTAPKRRPIVLAAHLDHPGFAIVRPLSDRCWLARFRGNVGTNYFRTGVRLRLMPGAIPARLGSRKGGDRLFVVRAGLKPPATPKFAVWELEDFAVRGGRIYGRACDDLIGAASVLTTLIELKKSRARVNVIGVFSRAEEVGFHGALVVAAGGGVPRRSLVISLETSRELPGAQMGQGVIVRVGDRASVFDSGATRFLAEVGADIRKRKKGFLFQRALMSGGTCEGTAYQEFKFQTAAVCVALGNYHNCGDGNKIEVEYVDVTDACGMVELLVAAAKQMPRYKSLADRLPKRLGKLFHEARRNLIGNQ